MHILITGGCGYTGTVLTNDLINLGYKVTVIDTQWFGNYLLPKNMALRNNKVNKDYFDKIKEEINKKEKEKKNNAIEILEKVKKINISFKKESDEKDQLYGTVSKKEILNFLLEQDIKLLSDDIKIINPIKSLGQHTIEVSPYEGLKEKIKIIVNKN